MIDSAALGLPWAIGGFLLAAGAIGVAGTFLSGICDRLADRTGMGEAFTGAIVLGAVTSLSGITVSVTAALDGLPTLALSNAIGGIAVQTAFLAVADVTYRRANLEHAAASVPNMMQAALLIVLLGMMLVAMTLPPVTVAGVHPLSPALLLVYGFGMRMVYQSRERPMWEPRMTRATRVDEPETTAGDLSLGRLLLQFAAAAVVVVLAGILATRSGEAIAGATGISHTLVGGLFLAVATSLPELVTSVAAVRRGALTLAVGGVVGGNAFDTLFAAVADVAYRPGSLYHAATEYETFLIALTIVMTAVLLLGLIRRERRGVARIGFESMAVFALYGLAVFVIAWS
ncbi:MAG: sodium:calcium antiporter [Halofilum sp. (in: g-proteobacteria)]|nr:sodium:calcium antiporter [Halofilum sp. (in: g-proteobacteria)]